MNSKIQVGEKDIQEYYRSHYSKVEKVRARHILFTVPIGAGPEEEKAAGERARSVLEKLEAGASFEQMAKEHSEDPSSALGGDLGWFRRGDMVAAFEKAAFGLNKGAISKLVRTRFGYHIIQVTDRSMETPKSLDDVRNEIRGRLQHEKFQRAMQDWLTGVRQQAFIEYRL